MTSCIAQFLVDIALLGVNPTAYSRFVTFTVKSLLPADNELATSTVDLFSGLSAASILAVILLILFTIVLIVIALVASGIIGLTTAIYIIAFAAACLAIYYAIAYVYAKKVSAEIAIPLQQDIRTAGILIVNSVVRDAIYLGLCV